MRSTSRKAYSALVFAVIAAGACGEQPTEPAQAIPSNLKAAAGVATVDVSAFLPPSMARDGDVFTMSMPRFHFASSLRGLCFTCTFSATQPTAWKGVDSGSGNSMTMPDGVVSFVMIDGIATIDANNGWRFDPTNPPGGGHGNVEFHFGLLPTPPQYITSFPAGGMSTISFHMVPGRVIGNFTFSFGLNSPAGGSSPADQVILVASDSLKFDTKVDSIMISSADVVIGNRTIAAVMPLNTTVIDTALVRHITGGTLDIEIDNPFPVSGPLTIAFSGAGTDGQEITTRIELPAGVTFSTVHVEFSAAELQAILREASALSISGVVTSSENVSALTPRQSMRFKASWDIDLN